MKVTTKNLNEIAIQVKNQPISSHIMVQENSSNKSICQLSKKKDNKVIISFLKRD